MLAINKRNYQLGLVKWFGGYNNQKGRENDFGFIQTMNGEDTFVHKNEIKTGIYLNKDELVIFEIGERNGKTYARNVYAPSRDPIVVESALKIYLKNKEALSKTFDSYSLSSSLRKLLNNDFIDYVDETTYLECLLIIFDNDHVYLFNKIDDYLSNKGALGVKLLKIVIKNLDQIGYKRIIQSENKSTYLSNKEIRNYIMSTLADSFDQLTNSELADLIGNGLFSYDKVLSNPSFIDFAYENLEKHKDLFSLLKSESQKDLHVYETIKDTNNWSEIFRKIVGRRVIKTILNSGVSLSLIPPDFIDEQEESLYKYIYNLKKSERNKFFDINIEYIPQNIILVSVIKGLLSNQDHILSYQNEINNLIDNKFQDNSEDLPDYVNSALDTLFENLNDYLSIRSIRSILEPLLFKKLLFQKNPNSKQFFDQSINLSTSTEHFILANLFPLILANNSIDVSFKVFLHNLWVSLKNEKIDISDVELFKLFPSCSTMGYNDLSCEAFYWPKNEIFLCRGNICHNPQVLPDTDKHFLDYNIYDWFKHFGVDYVNEGNPAKKDFPIKLAGYFNRLKEIFDIIKCRECNTLLIPDMRYARVEYFKYDPEKNEYVTKNTSAAYRVTVFECRNMKCIEYENKYYINHCIGFGCYSIIDSRDLRLKCDNGLYICRNCGSCCEQCAKNHPNGFCPDCGSNLNLFEKSGSRFVYCSKRDCNFRIPEDNLPKKFLLPSVPVRKIGESKGYRFSDKYEEDDLPF